MSFQNGDSFQLSVANTNRDGTGTLVSLVTGAVMGSNVQQVAIIATGTTTAGMIRFFVYDGTNTRLISELPVTAVTPSGSVQCFTGTFTFSGGLLLKPNYILKASTNNAETFNAFPTKVDL